MRLDRRSATLLTLLAALAPASLIALGPLGLVVYMLCWTLALPLLLPSVRAALFGELWGAVFFFLSAAFADNLDDVLGVEQRVSLALVACSFGYLAWRHRDLLPLVRTPWVLLLALFYAQQVVSAVELHGDEPLRLAESRLALLAALFVAAVIIVRRADGRLLVLWLVVLGALASVPLMVVEVARPDLRLFTFAGEAGPLRAGGMFGQANVVGVALDFALAALLTLGARGDASRRLVAVVGAVITVGLVACASRSAVVIALLVVAARLWAAARRRAGRAPLASALLVGGVVVLALPVVARAVVAEDRALADVGFEGVERLNELVLALAGSSRELADDDSGHLALAAAALPLIAEHPVAGAGTGNFLVRAESEAERGAHLQFLQILGENGAIGLGLYLVVLLALGAAVARLPPEPRMGALLLLTVWLLRHFDSHDLHSCRFAMAPLGYLCGLQWRARAAQRRPHAAP